MVCEIDYVAVIISFIGQKAWEKPFLVKYIWIFCTLLNTLQYLLEICSWEKHMAIRENE